MTIKLRSMIFKLTKNRSMFKNKIEIILSVLTGFLITFCFALPHLIIKENIWLDHKYGYPSIWLISFGRMPAHWLMIEPPSIFRWWISNHVVVIPISLLIDVLFWSLASYFLIKICKKGRNPNKNRPFENLTKEITKGHLI